MTTTYPPQFELFWKAYPRKVAKPTALKAWQKNGMEDDLYAAKAATDDVKKRTRMKWWAKDKTKIPHPSTWINAMRWHDEGWEAEIEQAERKPDTGRYVRPPQIPEREVHWTEAMLGRLYLCYVSLANGLQDALPALKIKRELMERYVPAYNESIDLGDMTTQQVAVELADLFLNRMDARYGLQLMDRVLTEARRTAQVGDGTDRE